MSSEEGKYFIEHAGVKGMKWGVVRDDDELARSRVGGASGNAKKAAKKADKAASDYAMAQAAKDFYKTKDPKQMQAEGKAKQKAKANQEFPSKNSKAGSKKDLEGDDVDPGGVKTSRLSAKQKRILAVGAGVAVAGLVAYGAQKAKKKHDDFDPELADILADYGLTPPGSSKSKKGSSTEAKARAAAHASDMDSLFGPGSHTPNPGNSFYTGLTSGKFIDRPEFTIPKTTVFQRLSGHPEDGTGYTNGAYATFLSNDKKQYGASMEFGKKAHTVTFNAKDEVRVPSAKTVLATLKATGGYDGKPLSDAETIAKYHVLSGGGWKDETSQKLISGLKKQGYSALVDDMDAGYYGDLPVVFFGEPDNVKATPRTLSDYKEDKKTKAPVLGRYA